MLKMQKTEVGNVHILNRVFKFALLILLIPLLNGCFAGCNFLTGYCP